MTSEADHAISFSRAFVENYGDLAIATINVGSIDRMQLSSRLSEVAATRLAAAASAERQILERIEKYERFFKKFDISSPLRRQLKSTREKGLPDIDPIIGTLLLAEMTTGVLMGVHDNDAIRGTITFDAAPEGDSFEGMRAEVRCRRGEIVARDDNGIIFSYFQGADRRTCVGSLANSVVYFAFGVPSLPNEDLRRALLVVAEVVGDAARLGSPTIHVAQLSREKREQGDVGGDPCLEPTCRNPGRFRLTRTYRAGPTLALAACREHTDRFHELVLSVKYGEAISATIERIGTHEVSSE